MEMSGSVRFCAVLVAVLSFTVLAEGKAQAQEWDSCWDCERCGNFLTQTIRCCRQSSEGGACRDEAPCHTQVMNISPCHVYAEPFPHCDGNGCGGGSDEGGKLIDIGIVDRPTGPCSGEFGCPAECASCGGDWGH
jgi:hypothetical protein